MTPEEQTRFPGREARLRDGRQAVIRPLSSEDGPALADFYASIPAEDRFFYCPHPLTAEKAMQNAAAADSPHEVVLVAQTPAGDIAGYAWYRWRDEDAAVSNFGICIRRTHQGVGLGGMLLSFLNDVAQCVGPKVMGLTVQKRNPRAVALYRNMGFRVVREQCRQSDGEPEYYMEREVR